MPDSSSLDRDFVFDYYKKHYDPSNYIITLVGKADFEKVCSYLEENFHSNNNSITTPEIIKQNSHTQDDLHLSCWKMETSYGLRD